MTILTKTCRRCKETFQYEYVGRAGGHRKYCRPCAKINRQECARDYYHYKFKPKVTTSVSQ